MQTMEIAAMGKISHASLEFVGEISLQEMEPPASWICTPALS